MFEHEGKEVKRVPIKGLPKDEAIPFEQFVEMMSSEAAEERRRHKQQKGYAPKPFAPKSQWRIHMEQALQQMLSQGAQNKIEQEQAIRESAAAIRQALANDEIPF